MSAFPVELVYVEKTPSFADRGKMQVILPACNEPITHVIYSIHLPEDGRYDGWSGNLKKVDAFARIGSTAYPSSAQADSQVEAVKLSNTVQQRVEQEAVAAGVTPIRVQLPVMGKPYLLEKILVLGDALSFEFRYQMRRSTW